MKIIQRRGLLIIDVQNEYFDGKLPVSYPEGSFSNIKRTIEHANSCKIPVVLIQHTAESPESPTFIKNSKEWEIHNEIVNLPHEIVIKKKFPSSFCKTGLKDYLNNLNIDTVTIAGYMSQMCCDSTAREAFHLGYNVEFLSDATGTLDIDNYAGSIKAEELHKAVLISQAMRFSKVMAVDDWIGSVR